MAQQQQMYLLHAPQCPHCVNFIKQLDATPAAAQRVTKVDVNTLPPDQRARVPAVPTLTGGPEGMLVGKKAFDWLKQFEQAGPESFILGTHVGLPFSEIDDPGGMLAYHANYSSF